MIWFTSDWHLNHYNILKYCNRPFKDVNQMNEIIINNYNSVVKEKDIVYFLGDFAFKNIAEFSERLNGTKYLLPGSHDKPSKTFGELGILEPIYEFYPPNLLDEYGNKRLIVLCHYSLRSWSKSHYASWHLFGHHHGKLEPHGLSFDIGVDTNNFYPYSLEDVEKKMKSLKPIVDFRKSKK